MSSNKSQLIEFKQGRQAARPGKYLTGDDVTGVSVQQTTSGEGNDQTRKPASQGVFKERRFAKFSRLGVILLKQLV